MDKAWPINSLRTGMGGIDDAEVDAVSRQRHRKTSVTTDQTHNPITGGRPPIPPKFDSKLKPQATVEPAAVDFERLEKKNLLLQHELNKAKTEFAKALEEVNKYSSEVGRLKQRLNQAEAVLQRAQSGSSYQSLRNENTQLSNALRDAYDQVSRLENRVVVEGTQLRQNEEKSRQNLASVYADNEMLLEKVKENEAKMHELLQDATKDARWNPPPDDTIRDRLKRLHEDTRDWAKRWAHETFSISHLKPELAADVRKLFANFVRCEADGSLPAAVESPNSKMKSRIPSLLLTAALAHLTEDEFFSNSFFCLDPKSSGVVRETYLLLEDANYQEANIWRSIIWRILNPPHTASMTEIDKAVSSETAQRVRNLCDRIVTDFFLSPASVLLRPVSGSDATERASSLRDILLYATDVATSLWTQRSLLSCVNMTRFTENRVSFKVTSSLMDAHPLNRVDPEATENNGRDMLIITRPCIIAIDESDRRNLKGDDFRVLAKAIVLLEDTRRPEASRP